MSSSDHTSAQDRLVGQTGEAESIGDDGQQEDPRERPKESDVNPALRSFLHKIHRTTHTHAHTHKTCTSKSIPLMWLDG